MAAATALSEKTPLKAHDVRQQMASRYLAAVAQSRDLDAPNVSLKDELAHIRRKVSEHRAAGRPQFPVIECFYDASCNHWEYLVDRYIMKRLVPRLELVKPTQRISRGDLGIALKDRDVALRLYYIMMQELKTRRRSFYLCTETIDVDLPPFGGLANTLSEIPGPISFELVVYSLMENVVETEFRLDRPILTNPRAASAPTAELPLTVQSILGRGATNRRRKRLRRTSGSSGSSSLSGDGDDEGFSLPGTPRKRDPASAAAAKESPRTPDDAASGSDDSSSEPGLPYAPRQQRSFIIGSGALLTPILRAHRPFVNVHDEMPPVPELGDDDQDVGAAAVTFHVDL